ncbi:hypothetical protein FDP41_002574 [Naegleria fowleri]|uniref:Uncharacterized protein n=1 Tax=Naegleria fowleri TaxID=5763 RepID=A0A6A5BYP4_NAEFO|nr:uncharacterized protein FDP41_002574 [Naegleria fowleri]KAF0978059.1 hypothetical protein FDP41_002574 [Naegleria fowleri]
MKNAARHLFSGKQASSTLSFSRFFRGVVFGVDTLGSASNLSLWKSLSNHHHTRNTSVRSFHLSSLLAKDEVTTKSLSSSNGLGGNGSGAEHNHVEQPTVSDDPNQKSISAAPQPTANNNSPIQVVSTIVLSFTNYDEWTKEEVASILCMKKGECGASLTVDDVKPLVDAGFKGNSLDNIVHNIKEVGRLAAISLLQDKFKDKNGMIELRLSDTCSSVVNWVNDALMPKLFGLWNAEQTKAALCESESKGGAGLTIEQVQPLYDAKFDGRSLSKIAEDIIKKRNEHFSIEREIQYATNVITSNKDFALVPESTCKAVAEWVVELIRGNFIEISSELLDRWKHRLEGEISEQLRKERTNPKYDYLRNLHDPTNMEKLEKLIGTNIQLPIFQEYGDLVPKNFDPTAKYLLTRQRFDILKKVVAGAEGFVFSGPHGVSKSYTLYLIAAYAFVNSIPVLYVPTCGSWRRRYIIGNIPGANKYLLGLFLSLNSDILSRDVISKLEESDDIVSYLSKYVAEDQRVFYLFDEHNELFRLDNDGKIFASKPYFQDFTRWTAATRGIHTMTIYCGSAHSSFEDHLPGGESLKIVRIVPPTEKEFNTLIEDFDLDPKEKRIDYVTGRIPRDLRKLASFLQGKKGTDEDFNQFITLTKDEYSRRLRVLDKKLDEEEKKLFLQTLEGLFTLGLYKGRPTDVGGIVYDQGLMYKDHDGKLFIVNEPAKRCLFQYYCSNIPRHIIPKNISGSEKGALFERCLITQEYHIGNHFAKFFITHMSNLESLSASLSYEINTHQSFSLKYIDIFNKRNYPRGTGVLFIPESENFPCFDYAIIMYGDEVVEIFLKQTTISTIDSHYCKDFKCSKTDLDNLITQQYIIDETNIAKTTTLELPKKYLFSLLELIFHAIVDDGKIEKVMTKRNDKDVQLYLKPKKHELQIVEDGNILKSVTYGGVQFTWHYIYESGTTSSEQSVKKVKEHGILYRNREEIENQMKVFFD